MLGFRGSGFRGLELRGLGFMYRAMCVSICALTIR